MHKSVSGLLFDNDGVLVDSMPGALEAWVEWGDKYHPSFELKASYMGRRASDIVRELVEPELFQEAYEFINQLELDKSITTQAFQGTMDLLDQLPEGKWNIVTGAGPELALARLLAAGIPIPSTLVTAYDAKKGKPDPEPYLIGAERLGTPLAECAVFEDAPAGLIAGQRGGAAFLVGIGEQTLDSVADVVVLSLEGLKYSDGVLEIPDDKRLR
ncbi:HAD-IA family hydrolase [Aquiluna sp.]|nr:HAD-IA family hydrolase [Aquiluna sp.]MDA8927415.1 HAD-IA family hydrolase [Aquiluna sp.]